MVNDENERSGAIVHHTGRFSLTECGEGALEILAASATCARVQIEFQIVVGAPDVNQSIKRFGCERRAAQVRVNNDAGTVDYRLQTTVAKPVERNLDSLDRIATPLFRVAGLRKFLPNRLNNKRTWQIGSRNLFEHFADRWNLPARSHVTTRMSGSPRRVIRPMIAWAAVRFRFRT